MTTAATVLQVAKRYIGMAQYSPLHRALIEAYNQVQPAPVGYYVSVDDDWCDIFVTVCGDLAGASNVIGRECGVPRHVAWFKAQGIWLGKVVPQAGDIIVFQRGDVLGHIGFVDSITAGNIRTIEGNYNRHVAYGYYRWNDNGIAGYARPRYAVGNEAEVTGGERVISQELIEAIWRGEWGNGEERVKRLRQAGYDLAQVQRQVNEYGARHRSPQNNVGLLCYRVPLAATHWATGEKMAEWVAGTEFEVLAQKGKRLLLGRRQQAVGWVERCDER